MKLDQILRRHGVAVDDVGELSRWFQETEIPPSRPIYREGDLANAFYLVKNGTITLSRRDRFNYDEPVAQFAPGDYFGETELLDQTSRRGTARATEPAVLYVLDDREFDQAYARSASFKGFIDRHFKFRLLRRASIFHDVDDANLETIQSRLVEFDFDRRQAVFSEADPPLGLYIVKRGQVRLTRRTVDGRADTLEICKQGEFFNETSLISPSSDLISAETVEKTTLLALPRDDFQELLKGNLELVMMLLEKLHQRVRRNQVETPRGGGASQVFQGMTILTRADRCLSCRSCEIACVLANSKSNTLSRALREVPQPVRRIHVRSVNDGSSETMIRPEHCMNCRDAPCLARCRKNAIKRDPKTKYIEIIPDACVGCGLCAKACPFDVITLTQTEGKKRVALKCNYCAEHQSGPSCVRSCPTNALVIALPTVSET